MLLNKGVAVVTGVASGIGKCVAEQLIGDNIRVFGIDKTNVEIAGMDFYLCDITVNADLDAVFGEIRKNTDKIDYLVLAAGILCSENRALIEDTSDDEWFTVINTDLTGNFEIIKRAIPLLKESGFGSIVTYSSEQVVNPIVKSAPYLVAKAGMEALTKLVALELVPYKIRANCIQAASVKTGFLSSLVKEPEIMKMMIDDMDKKMPLGIIEDNDIASLTLFLLSTRSRKITGQIIGIDSGMLL